MFNFIPGLLTILICCIGYFYSWKYSAKDNYKLAVFLLLICGLVLRIYTSSDFFLHSWDERYHALVAKNMIQHPFQPMLYSNPVLPYDYTYWAGNHIWLHKQPLPLWTMALSMWIFGVNEIALRLPSILLTAIGIALTYSIGKYLFSRKTGFIAAFLYSINGLIIEISAGRIATDHIDVFFLFFIELAIFFSILFAKNKKTMFTVFAGVAVGAAVLSKWLPPFIVFPIWMLIVIDSGNFKFKEIFLQFLLLLATSVAVFLPYQIYIFHSFPKEAIWESFMNIKHLTTVLQSQTGPWYYFLEKIRINYGELIYIPMLWYLWKMYKTPFDLKRLSLVIWILVPLVFFSLVKTKMQAYILFTAPALFLITADFFGMLFNFMQNHKYKWAFYIVLILIIALPIRYSIGESSPLKSSTEIRNGIGFKVSQ